MSKPNLAKIVKNVQMIVSKRSPEILTGIGIAGMITTTILAVKATPKALDLIAKKEDELDLNTEERLTPIETVKVAWKPYIPAVATGIISVTCLIGASSVSAKRTAALAAAYQISETALTEYRDKVVETIGEKKERTIQEKVKKDRVDKNPVSKNEVIVTEKGNTLCYDIHSGRYFKSDIEKIKKAVNELNRQMLSDMYISLNQFYYELGLEGTKIGDELGWNVDDGMIDVDFSSHLADDGTPCIAIDYRIAPRYDYSKFM